MDIGLVSWNTCPELRSALESVRRHGGGRRVLVVDNASSDGTVEMVREGFPEVELIAERSNRGFAGGANVLLDRAAPEDLLLLNADVELTAGAVDRLESALRELPRAAAVAPRLLGRDGTPEHSAYPFPSLALAALMNSGLWRLAPAEWRDARLLPGAAPPLSRRRVPWVIGAAVALRRAAVREVGGLDARYFMYAEDLDWCLRAARAGWETWIEPAATIVHLGNRSGSQAFGGLRTAAWLESTYAFAQRAHGRVWSRAFFAMNAAGTAVRYAGARARNAVAPSPTARRAVDRWAPYVAYHLRGARPVRERARAAGG